MTKQILGDKYDAYIGNNDMTALGILACLKDHNIKTSVAGFDNIPETDFPQIQLTTVDHGACEKGKGSCRHSSRTNKKRTKTYRPYGI